MNDCKYKKKIIIFSFYVVYIVLIEYNIFILWCDYDEVFDYSWLYLLSMIIKDLIIEYWL